MYKICVHFIFIWVGYFLVSTSVWYLFGNKTKQRNKITRILYYCHWQFMLCRVDNFWSICLHWDWCLLLFPKKKNSVPPVLFAFCLIIYYNLKYLWYFMYYSLFFLSLSSHFWHILIENGHCMWQRLWWTRAQENSTGRCIKHNKKIHIIQYASIKIGHHLLIVWGDLFSFSVFGMHNKASNRMNVKTYSTLSSFIF